MKKLLLPVLVMMSCSCSYASELMITNQDGSNYLQNDGNGVLAFKDKNGESYNKIIYNKDFLSSSIMFIGKNFQNTEINTVCDELSINNEKDATTFIVASLDHTKNTVFNFGKNDGKHIESINISSIAPFSQEGAIVARGENNKLKFWGKNINLNITDNPDKWSNDVILATGAYSDNTSINIDTVQDGTVVIKGDLSGGYNPKWLAGKYTASKNGNIMINDSENAVVRINGNVYTANIVSGGREYANNVISIKLPNTESYLTGMVKDVTNKQDNNAGTHLIMKNNSIWNVTDSSIISNLDISDSATVKVNYVENPAEAYKFKKIVVLNDMRGNNGTLKLNVDASKNYENSDRIYINGTHEGIHYISLNNIGDKVAGAEGTVIVSVNNEQGEFRIPDQEGPLYWNEYTLNKIESSVYTEKDSADWALGKVVERKDKPSVTLETGFAVNELNYHTWRTEANKLMQRMGDLHYGNGDDTGAWVRVHGSKIGRDGDAAFENRYTAYELGYDVLNYDSNKYKRYIGAAVSYTDGNSSYANGYGKNHSLGLGFYTTTINNKGHYLDLLFKISDLDNDFNILDASKRKIYGKNSNKGISLSAEYGRRNALGNEWYWEPQGQLTAGYLGSDTYSVDNGTQITYDGVSSLVGRAGFNIGREIDEKANFYVKANVLHEFMGSNEVEAKHAATGTSMLKKVSFKDTWYEVGVGATLKTGKNNYLYCDMEKSFGGDFKKSWLWNAGMRWEF